MPDNPSEDGEQEQQKEMKWEIPICADDWLAVFALLPPRQLGLEIALLSPRFDRMVDEHFKTRRWALKYFRIKSKIGENGTKEMRIKNHNRKVAPIVPIPRIPLPDKVVDFSSISIRSKIGKDGNIEILIKNNYLPRKVAPIVPIPNIPLPDKVVDFSCISIRYIDNDVITFLQRFQRLFASCAINLKIIAKNTAILQSVESFIWPMIRQNICGIIFCNTEDFCRLQTYAPSILRHILSIEDDKSPQKMPLQSVAFYKGELPKLPPAVESANANGNVPWSGSEALAKWLFSSRPENGLPPKVLQCGFDRNTMMDWAQKIVQYRTAFVNGTSPRANFIVFFACIHPLFEARLTATFELANYSTAERLTFKQLKPKNKSDKRFLLIRCPIARDEEKWAKWEAAAMKGQYDNPRNLITIWEKDENAERVYFSKLKAQMVSKNE